MICKLLLRACAYMSTAEDSWLLPIWKLKAVKLRPGDIQPLRLLKTETEQHTLEPSALVYGQK